MRVVASAMGVAIAAVFSASCLSATSMASEQKICCAAMGHDCPDVALETDCCDFEMGEALTPLTRGELAPPSPAGALIELPEPAATFAGAIATARTAPVKPPGTATYLVVSSFRI